MSTQPNMFPDKPLPDHCLTAAARARQSDPATSRAAAKSQQAKGMTETKRLILEVLRDHGPLTDGNIFIHLARMGHRVSPSGARTRRASLVYDHGKIIDSGQVAQLESGRNAIVWRLAG